MMESLDITSILVQLPLLAIFAWLFLKLEERYRTSMEKRDEMWKDFLSSQNSSWQEQTTLLSTQWKEFIADQNGKWQELYNQQRSRWGEMIARLAEEMKTLAEKTAEVSGVLLSHDQRNQEYITRQREFAAETKQQLNRLVIDADTDKVPIRKQSK